MSPALLGATLLAGIGGGCVGALYLLFLHLLQHVLWPDRWGDLAVFGVLAATGAGVVVITRLLGSPGDVELLVDNIHVAGGPSDLRTLRSLIPTSLLTISAGGAAGPEAPLVTTCGTVAARVARMRRLDVAETRSVTIAGMAAAFAVLFGAPLGSALFALEILHRRGMEYVEALIPAVVGGISGWVAYVLLTDAGLTPPWQIPHVATLRPVDIAWAVGAGVAGAIVAIAFTYTVILIKRIAALIPMGVRPVLGGLVLATLALWSRAALTFGEAQTAKTLTTHIALSVLLVGAVAKLLGTSVTVSSGWPGGFIIPLFFIGASLGMAAHHVFPDAQAGVMAAGIMAAANIGVTKTLLGSTLVVTEMGGLRLLPTTIIAATIALMLTSEVGLIHSQRERTDLADPSSSSG
jgi:H+/Cl- antiporter ClcA